MGGRSGGTPAFLRRVDLFTGLTDSQLEELARQATRREVQAGEWLFRAGDAGDDVMVVMHGRLEIHVPDAPEPVTPGVLGPGDVVGELAVLTRTPRSASVLARRDTQLLVLERSAVLDVLESTPETAIGVAAGLAARLQRSVGLPTKPTSNDVIALIGWDHRIDVTPIAEATARAMRGTTLSRSTANDRSDFAERLANAERAHEHVILVASRDVDDEWYRFCLRSADRTIVVIDARDDAPTSGDHTELAGVAVAFVDGTDAATPGRVARWIDLLGATTWFQLGSRDRVEHGSARMARRLTGRAIGVVLSGGGARGFAHVGALQGLLEHGVTIDRVGGCSMGALVAALHATGRSPTAMVDALRSGFTRRSTLRQISLSRQSLLRGDRLDQLLGELLGDRTFEALLPSAFVVSADLLTAELVQHRRGRVATAVRASMAIPGLLPPVQQDTRLLVDGGLVDGLPVAMMADSGEGPVIAVDVMRDHPRSRSNRGRGVLEILSLAALIGRRPAKTKGRDLAAAMVVPDVSEIGLLDFHCIDKAAEAGRNAVARAAESGALDAALVAAGAHAVE